MHFIIGTSVAAAMALSLGVEAVPTKMNNMLQNRSLNVTTWKPTAFAGSSTLSKSSNFLEMKKVRRPGGSKRSAAYLKSLTTTPSGSTGLLSLLRGEEFAVSMTFGTQTFDVILDTGSSDTWVVEKGFECLSESNDQEISQASCGFGKAYTIDSTFSKIANEQFSISYEDGESLQGVMGTEKITLAGITVNKQTIALATSAAWQGDGTSSGLTGFAYPAITSALSTNTNDQVVYNPLFTTMYEDGLVDSYFSLAILRDVSGPAGYLTLGGLPPITFNETFATTPILVTSTGSHDFYTIDVDSINVKGKALTGGSSAKYIVDSGTTLNNYPTNIANAINAAFSPPATYNADQGAYTVECDAIPPAHSITIGGVTFTINPLDMILSNGDNTCSSGITDGGSSSTPGNLFILGDVFLKNVVSVFDVGAAEMKFAPHENYTSNDTF